MRRTVRAIPLLAALLVLPACPGSDGSGADDGDAAQDGDAGGDGAGAADGGAGGADGDGADGGGGADADDGAGSPADAEPWQVIPADAAIVDVDQGGWPMLAPVTEWPSPQALEPVSELPRDERPDATRERLLQEIVRLLVAEDLRPRDPDAALGMDPQGRLHMELGRTKAEGSATLESHGEKYPPVCSMTVQTNEPAAEDMDALSAQVDAVVAEAVREELAKEEAAFHPHPSLKADYPQAANAFLDPSGSVGMQFRYVYAYSAEGKLLLVFQEVPHRQLPEEGGG